MVGLTEGDEMTKPNQTQKRIIKALANAPAAALRELLRQTTDPAEHDQIKRIAAALGVKLEG